MLSFVLGDITMRLQGMVRNGAASGQSASMEDMQQTGALAAAAAASDGTPVSMNVTAGVSPFDEVC